MILPVSGTNTYFSNCQNASKFGKRDRGAMTPQFEVILPICLDQDIVHTGLENCVAVNELERGGG